MIAYLDNSATTKPSEGVIEAMSECMRAGYFNPSSVYAPAVDALRCINACRERILSELHARAHKLIFTSGGTEANNLAILGSVEAMRGKQVVAVSAVEHPSVLAAFHELGTLGHDVRIIDADMSGQPDWAALERALNDGAALVSMMQVNNETGALLDVKRLYELVGKRALIHVDGVQGFMRVPFDMKYADMYTLSSHKIHGPKGEGALVISNDVRIKPRQLGGGQEFALRSGTENTPGIAGLFKAVCELSDMPAELMQNKLYLIERFREAAPDLSINGAAPEISAPHIVNISFPFVRGEVLLHALEANGVYASTGSACSSKKRKVSAVLTAMGIPVERAECALRFSLSPYTTIEEIDHAAEALKLVYPTLRRFQRR